MSTSPKLRQIVKQETRAIHKYTEDLPIMRQIINQFIRPETYYCYLSQLLPIYEILESLEICPDSVEGIAKLCRKDLEKLQQDHGFSEPVIFPITKIYTEYLSKQFDKCALTAHYYVRYLADAKGGQILKSRLSKIGLPTNVYNLEYVTVEKDIDKMIIDVWDESVFLCETHHAFMAYTAILTTICS